jgi:integrase
MLITMINTGIRRGEAFTLSWRDVDLGAGVLTIRAENSKNGSSRTIPLNTTALETLRDWREHRQFPDSALVFPHPRTGARLQDIDSIWESLTHAAGLTGVRLHDLRHTCATRLIKNGADVYTVKDILGHGSIAVTEIYLHTTDDRKSAAVQGIDRLTCYKQENER